MTDATPIERTGSAVKTLRTIALILASIILTAALLAAWKLAAQMIVLAREASR